MCSPQLLSRDEGVEGRSWQVHQGMVRATTSSSSDDLWGVLLAAGHTASSFAEALLIPWRGVLQLATSTSFPQKAAAVVVFVTVVCSGPMHRPPLP